MEWRHGTFQCPRCRFKIGCCEGETGTAGRGSRAVSVPASVGILIPEPWRCLQHPPEPDDATTSRSPTRSGRSRSSIASSLAPTGTGGGRRHDRHPSRTTSRKDPFVASHPISGRGSCSRCSASCSSSCSFPRESGSPGETTTTRTRPPTTGTFDATTCDDDHADVPTTSPDASAVPELTGLTLEEARALLEQTGRARARATHPLGRPRGRSARAIARARRTDLGRHRRDPHRVQGPGPRASHGAARRGTARRARRRPCCAKRGSTWRSRPSARRSPREPSSARRPAPEEEVAPRHDRRAGGGRARPSPSR